MRQSCNSIDPCSSAPPGQASPLQAFGSVWAGHRAGLSEEQALHGACYCFPRSTGVRASAGLSLWAGTRAERPGGWGHLMVFLNFLPRSSFMNSSTTRFLSLCIWTLMSLGMSGISQSTKSLINMTTFCTERQERSDICVRGTLSETSSNYKTIKTEKITLKLLNWSFYFLYIFWKWHYFHHI